MTLARMDLRLATYKDIYISLFKDIVEIPPYGVLCKERVMRELADYAIFMENAGKVFYEVTNGRVSKINTHAEIVISLYQDIITDLIREALTDELEILRGKCTCGAAKEHQL